MNKPDGGPAYPMPSWLEFAPGSTNAAEYRPQQPGMSLRDYFAATCPTLSLYSIRSLKEWPTDLPEGNDGDEDFVDSIIGRLKELPVVDLLALEAKWAYLYADAMLKERSRE